MQTVSGFLLNPSREAGVQTPGVAHLDRHFGEVVRVPETSGDVDPKVLAVFYHILPKTNILQ